MKKLLFLLSLSLLCGCAREPSPVSALALDRAGNGYRLTAELVRQDTPEDAAVPSCLAAQGDSFTDALHALEGLLPGELYLSHAQVLLLSEQAAEDDLTPLAEYLCRDNDIRLNLRCAVVRGGAASDLLENDEEVYALSDLLDRAAETGTLPDMPLYRVTEADELRLPSRVMPTSSRTVCCKRRSPARNSPPQTKTCAPRPRSSPQAASRRQITASATSTSCSSPPI